MVEYEPNIRPGFHILTLRTFDLITVASSPFFLVLYHLDAYFCFPASFISQTCCKNNLVSIKYTCVKGIISMKIRIILYCFECRDMLRL